MEWQFEKLGDICKFSSGGTPSKKNKNYWDGSIPWVSGRDMKSESLFDSYLHISTKAIDETAARLAPKGTILVLVRGMGLAHGAQVAELMVPAAFNQDIKGVHTDAGVLPRYLALALRQKINSTENVLSSAAHGTLKIDMEELANLVIPLPPISEQKRIVAILDQVFADIDRARALTEQNLKNARELFDSTLQQVFSQRGEGWELKMVGEFADTCLGKMLDKRKNKGDPKPYLRNLNVRWFHFELDDLLEMKFEASEFERYSVKKGDLLICEGGYPGRCAIWQHDEEIYFQKALHRVRCESAAYNLWLLYFLYLSDRNGSLKESFTGAGIQHFTGKALKKLFVPLPKESVALEYTKKFGEILERIQEIEILYIKKVEALDELKKSLLQKAFSGQLTAKDAA